MKLKKIITSLLSIALFLPVISVNAVSVQKITPINFSDKDYIFRIKGSNQEFLLLEETDDNSSKFFVCAIGYYGRKAWHTGNKDKFDPDDPQCMSYFLNHDFLTTGTLSGFKLTYHKLPDDIIKHIDFNHIWDCDPGKMGGEASSAYKIKCGVTIPSQTEVMKYRDRIGWDDNYRSFDNDVTLYPWGTRSVTNEGAIIAVRPNVSMTQFSTFGQTSELIGIRPVFYLDLNFFKDVRVDLTHTGGKVLELFKKYYTIDEMKKLYSETECYDYLGYKTEVTLEYSDGKCNLTNNTDKEINAIVLAVYYDEGNFPINQNFKIVKLAAKENLKISVELNNEKSRYAQITVCEAGDTALYRTISNSQRIEMR